MKIMFMVSSMNAGGAERVAATLSNAWADQGHQVVLVSTFPVKGQSFYALGAAVRMVWLADLMGRRTRSLIAPLWKLLAMRRFVRREQPDVVVSFLTNVNVMTLLATWGLGIPVVVCERTNPAFNKNVEWQVSLLRRWLYPRANAVCVQTRATAIDFAAMIKGVPSIEVLPNPLPRDIEELPVATLQPDNQGRYRLVAMGRLHPNKQFDRLVAMFARLHAEFPEWDLHIYGEGPLRASLEAQIQALGLGNRVNLPGRTTAAWQALSQGSVFAMTSSVEGFPNVLMEAMALGLPAVVYDCPSGPHEMTDGGHYARLVNMGAEDDFVAALRALMSNPAERARLGQEAAYAMRRHYGLPIVLAHWQSVFSKVCCHHE